jgi:PKD repeat protein
MRTNLHFFCITLLLLIVAHPATAQIVINGGFETGDFTDWTLSGDTGNTSVQGIDNFYGIMPYSGNYEAELGTFNSFGHVSQTLSTTAGAGYLLSFWLINPFGETPNEFIVSWNGTKVFDQTNFAVSVWTNIQILVTTTETNAVLQFGFLDNNGILGLDNISVVENPFVHFTANPSYGTPPLMVQFVCPSIDNNGNTITNWNWSFGDSSTSTAQNPTHIYTTEGNFSPNLIATNIYGSAVVGLGPSIIATSSNDNFTNRISLTGVGLGNNFAATLEPNEPDPGGGIGSVTNTATNGIVSVISVTNTVTNTVWWSWTAPTNGPASVLTLGSSFDTILDVYTGNALSSLTCIASNLNTVLDDDLYSYQNPDVGIFSPANAGVPDRVGFTASAGTTYQIQISGLSEGLIDIAVQPIALKILSVNQVSTNKDGSVNFNAVVEVGNSGLLTSAPLQLEVLASAGYSYDSNSGLPPPTNSIPVNQVLTNYYLDDPATVMPGTTTNISISGVCPGPNYVIDSYGNTNSGFGWGVYVVLEEQFSANWFFMDNDLLFYGQWPTISGTEGVNGGVIRLNPSQLITASDPGYVQFQLEPPAAVAAGAGWKLEGDSTYSSATNYIRAVTTTNAFTVEFKPIPGWNLPTNQTMTVLPGQISSQTVFYTVTNPVLVADNSIGLGITGTTNTVYQIQRRTSLTSGSWLSVSTNTINSNGFNLVLPNPATNGNAFFYRAVWLGQ